MAILFEVELTQSTQMTKRRSDRDIYLQGHTVPQAAA